MSLPFQPLNLRVPDACERAQGQKRNHPVTGAGQNLSQLRRRENLDVPLPILHPATDSSSSWSFGTYRLASAKPNSECKEVRMLFRVRGDSPDDRSQASISPPDTAHDTRL